MFCHSFFPGAVSEVGWGHKRQREVTDIQPGPIVTLSTTGGVYQAKSVVITAGPWANRLLAHTGLQLPLEVFKPLVFHVH